MRGFLLVQSAELSLVHVLTEDYLLNGYAVIHHSSVRAWRTIEPEEFTARAVRLKRLRPKPVPGLDLSDWKSAIASAGERFPLLAIHRETECPGVCFIGRLLEVNSRSAAIEELDTQASWTGPARYALRQITRLGFGGGYEDALARVAAS